MEQTGQAVGNSMTRPIARPMPVQRANYGLPAQPAAPVPGQASAPVATQPVVESVPTPQFQAAQPAFTPQPAVAPTPVGNRVMDIAPARPNFTPTPPVAPQPVMTQPAAMPAPTAAPAPLFQATPQPAAAPVAPTIPQRPLFTPTASVAPKEVRERYARPKVFTLIKTGLYVLAAVAVIAGIGRWATAGSTANDTIAVGAVAANDGRSMTIQFTATDGKLHKFAAKSNQNMIPGTAVELAYKSGAPDATVRQVSTIKAKRQLGLTILLVGIIAAVAATAMSGVVRLQNRGKRHTTHLSAATAQA